MAGLGYAGGHRGKRVDNTRRAIQGNARAQRVFVVAPVGALGSGKTRLLKKVFDKLAVQHGKYRQHLVEQGSAKDGGATIWDAIYLCSDEFAAGGKHNQRLQSTRLREACESFTLEKVGRAPAGSNHVVLLDKNHIHAGDLKRSATPFMQPGITVRVIALFLADTDDVAGEEKVWNYPWSPKTMAVCLKRVLERDAHPTLGSAANDDRKKASVFLKFWRLFERHRGLEESNLVSSVLVLPIVGGGRWKEDGTGLAKEILASDIDSDESGEKVLEKVKKLVAMLECGEESSAEFDKCVDLVVQKVRTLASAPLASRALPPRTLTAPTPPFQLRCPLYVGVEISGANKELLLRHAANLLDLSRWNVKEELHVTLLFLRSRYPEGERRKQIVQAIAMGEDMMATVSPKRLLVVPGRLVCAEVEVDGPGFLDDLQPQPHLHITMALDNGCPAKLSGRFLMGFKEQWEVIEGTRLSDIEAFDFSDNVRLSDCRVKSYFR
ncbi:hypothetical protein FOZ63_025791 [Perkinsus olseni]|uniref:Uncharacterized protein n=1 Tax=Perkinsus olseni TaxID=32597 RepID=A0A7J6ST58_PEROL|nr:hypothetical protein FOZ63_025791 [Perkinsus olseni]